MPAPLMARPRSYEEPRIATAVRLPESLRDDLAARAAERDVSVNYLVVRALTDYLGRLAPLESQDDHDEGQL